MHTVVVVKQVPDPAEGLEIDPSGAGLDDSFLAFRLSEFDEHAVEQAVLLKEASGGTVTVVALDAGEPDESLYTCAAKGADRLIKVASSAATGAGNQAVCDLLAPVIVELKPDLVLTGVQAIDDLDGPLAPRLAMALGLPWVTVVTGVRADGAVATVQKEYAGGVVAELAVDLPAVLGIQAAVEPPRYVAISRVRQAMKNSVIEELTAATVASGAGGPQVTLRRMYLADTGSRAEMIEGDPEAVAERICAILAANGLVKGQSHG